MATGQAASVYNMGSNRRIRSPYVERIQSAYGQATADVVARKQKEQEQAAQEFDQKIATQNLALANKEFQSNKQYQQNQLGLQRAQMKAEADAQRRAMGMNIGTLGMNLAGRAANNPNLRVGIGNSSGLNLAGSSGINLGSLAGAGLAGYGAYQAMGGGTKGLAAGLGAGLLTDAVSGGGLSSALSSGLTKLPGIGKGIETGLGALSGAMDWLF